MGQLEEVTKENKEKEKIIKKEQKHVEKLDHMQSELSLKIESLIENKMQLEKQLEEMKKKNQEKEEQINEQQKQTEKLNYQSQKILKKIKKKNKEQKIEIKAKK